MTNHTPLMTPGTVVITQSGLGLLITVPCNCDAPGCKFTKHLYDYNLTYSPVPKPRDIYVHGSKIQAIKEVRGVTQMTLIEAKNFVQEADEQIGRYTTYEGKDGVSGYPFFMVCTYLPFGDQQHSYVVSIRYQDN
jgi:hypothetical protein